MFYAGSRLVLLLVLRLIWVEKLVIWIVYYVNCTVEVFGPRLFIGFCRWRCRKENKRLILTYVYYGDNGKKIGLLPSPSLQDSTSSVIHTRRFSSNIGIDFIYEPMNEELKIRLT